MNKKIIGSIIVLTLLSGYLRAQVEKYYQPWRPQVHFSPQQHWMNDPNGMVYNKGIYHLFFQYYPGATVWGPMHWGHAESRDMIHWKELPIALYPDSLGYIFSGSAVVDAKNTSGFGKNGKQPMVAIFTSHDPKGEKAGTNNFQTESLAYSLDNGNTWVKYSGNPVLKNPGITDFRDPKVFWYAPQNKWLMTLATHDHITFYSSPNLKSWIKESEFGKEIGAHGGVWECPDLFPLTLDGKAYWVLIVNLNPGGPNGGSATQYFLGQFNGSEFTPIDTKTRWVDYGPDEYAGITWGNTGARKIFLGWMSNWLYANQVPTKLWRNAMTVPRQLSLKKENGNLLLASNPISELKGDYAKAAEFKAITVNKHLDIAAKSKVTSGRFMLKMKMTQLKDYVLKLSNKNHEEVLIGYNTKANQYYIDRTHAGKAGFYKEFAGRFTAPRLTGAKASDITLVVDKASVEVFADGGLTVMTAIYFSSADLTGVTLHTDGRLKLDYLHVASLKSIWVK